MSEPRYDAYEAAEKAKEKHGKIIRVVESDNMHLQIDWDKPDFAIATYIVTPVFHFLVEEGIIEDESLITISPGGNKHIYLKLTEGQHPHKRIAMQLALDSDPQRELLSMFGPQAGNKIVLFETEEEYKNVCKWLGREPVEYKPPVSEEDDLLCT